jgi:hypothetical protein
MMVRFAICLLMLGLSAWHSAVLATDALVPPEAIPLGRYGIGVQVELAGRVFDADSVKSREDARARCNGWGVPYVNPVPIENVGRIREVVVQLEDASYVWGEMEVAEPLDRFACQFGPKTIRKLTIARYNGKQTHITRYQYDTRKYGLQIIEGDKTHFGTSGSYTPPTTDPKSEASEVRSIAGMTCRVETMTPGFMWRCVTKDHPVPGRKRPLTLALKTTKMQMEATSITPNVRVDLGALDGPPGFKRPKSTKPEKADDDDEATVPGDSGRRP